MSDLEAVVVVFGLAITVIGWACAWRCERVEQGLRELRVRLAEIEDRTHRARP